MRVLITDYVHPVLIADMRSLGYFVHYIPEIERQQLLEWIEGCTGIVINTKTVADAQLIAQGTSLRWIARLGSGLDIIDLEAAAAQGITVMNTPQANASAVAEHMFGMLLSAMHRICRAGSQMRSGMWLREPNRGTELGGKVVGIIGYGNTGRAFASKFAGWHVQILAYDKYKTRYAADMPWVRECAILEEVLSQADVVSLHLPLTQETRHFVNEAFLSKCKPGVILLNSSRGKIVDTLALMKALESGHLGGACLDVFEHEKPEAFNAEEVALMNRLLSMDRVVVTPHIAGWTFESRERIAEQVILQVSALAQH